QLSERQRRQLDPGPGARALDGFGVDVGPHHAGVRHAASDDGLHNGSASSISAPAGSASKAASAAAMVSSCWGTSMLRLSLRFTVSSQIDERPGRAAGALYAVPLTSPFR